MPIQRNENRLQRFALALLSHPTDVDCFESLVACLARISPKHSQWMKQCVRRIGGLRNYVALTVVAELFCQRSAIAFTGECVKHVMDTSAFDHKIAFALLERVGEWLTGTSTKKSVLDLGEEVAQQAQEWERGWFSRYNAIPAPVDKKTQHEIDASQEPLFVYDAALALSAATQPSERSGGCQLGHYRQWFDSVDKALSTSLEAVSCRAPRGGKRQAAMVQAENEWRVARLSSILVTAKLGSDGFVTALDGAETKAGRTSRSS